MGNTDQDFEIVSELITFEMVRDIEEGSTIKLNENYELYFYDQGDSLVVIRLEDDEEIFVVQANFITKDVIFTTL